MANGLRGLKHETVEIQEQEFLITEMTMKQGEQILEIFSQFNINSLSEFLEKFVLKPQNLIELLRGKKLHRQFIEVIISPFGDNTSDDIDWDFLSVRESVRLVESFLALNESWRKDVKKSLTNSMQGLVQLVPQILTASSTRLNKLKENTEQKTSPGEKSKKT